MANVFDVADYILNKKTNITTMQLQKMVYYSQAWALAWNDTPIFNENFEAWKNGPVCRELYNTHKGYKWPKPHIIDSKKTNHLTEGHKQVIDYVIEKYGQLNGDDLAEQTHQETPWQSARGELSEDERSCEIIDKDSMKRYYQSKEDEMLAEIFNNRQEESEETITYSLDEVFS